jgi:hypothetical protein
VYRGAVYLQENLLPGRHRFSGCGYMCRYAVTSEALSAVGVQQSGGLSIIGRGNKTTKRLLLDFSDPVQSVVKNVLVGKLPCSLGSVVGSQSQPDASTDWRLEAPVRPAMSAWRRELKRACRFQLAQLKQA